MLTSELDKYFEQLGIGRHERLVYLDLAQNGSAAAQTISKRLKIARTTVYWALDQLGNRGLVAVEQRNGSSIFLLNPPQAIVRMVSQEREKALRRFADQEAAAQIVSQSISIEPRKIGRVNNKIQYYDGEENIRSLLYDHLPLWQNSMAQSDHTWWGYQDPCFAQYYRDWIKDTWSKRRSGEFYRVFTNRSKIEEQLAAEAPEFRGMRFVPDGLNFSSTIWVVGDFLVLIFSQAQPHYAMQLRNSHFADGVRDIFRLLWETTGGGSGRGRKRKSET